MKKGIISILTILLSLSCFAQTDTAAVQYKYYMIVARPTGKMQIEVCPERNIVYDDIDSLLVDKREKDRKGNDEVECKIYNSMSEFFNALGAHGLEFINHYKWNMVGGMTGKIVGAVYSDYFIFRKRVVTK